METPERFVPQEQHDAAVLALRAELSEAINAKQAEIDELKQQVAEATANAMTQVVQEFEQVKAERNQYQAQATAYRNDNQALRKNLAEYLTSTDGGQAALKEFNIYILQTQQTAITKRLAELGVT